MGFLSEGGQVSFSIDTPEEALLQEYGEEMETEVKQHLKNRISITIEIVDYHTGDRGDFFHRHSCQRGRSPMPAGQQKPDRNRHRRLPRKKHRLSRRKHRIPVPRPRMILPTPQPSSLRELLLMRIQIMERQ